MATRAYLFVKENEQYKGIYNHSDGYPSYLGKMLKKYYNTAEKANQLVNTGGVIFLEKNNRRIKPF
ncbi:hypothetical protein ACQ1R0_03780 [Ornithobacterium rhinotracheale]|uniref:hypothetical protein n=1 Tax=Ornithobacterium rhinotracheale TaxID=28251 RepID=UPI00403500DD